MISHYGFQELHEEVFRLDADELLQLLGPALTARDVLEVDVEELRTVLQMVGQSTVPLQPDLRPVPIGKAEYNNLSQPVMALLNAGRARAHLVQKALTSWFDPTVGDRIASGLRKRYEVMRDSGASQSEIFSDLQTYAGGLTLGPPEHQAAVLAVISYYFDECDVFARPVATNQ
ncbi:MAG TPA: ABC-three component system protein [Longimicrobium sp.]|nr:ABC-three component system protein [Longimicrobium sp.]